MLIGCERCGLKPPYCDAACKQRAYRVRKAEEASTFRQQVQAQIPHDPSSRSPAEVVEILNYFLRTDRTTGERLAVRGTVSPEFQSAVSEIIGPTDGVSVIDILSYCFGQRIEFDGSAFALLTES